MNASKGISRGCGLVAALASLLALACAHADSSTPLVQPSPSASFTPEGALGTNTGMYGWNFWLLEPVVVTGVGWYDVGRDGLLNSHEIGLWQGSLYDYTGLVFSATVPAGTVAPLEGDWRKVDFNVSLTLKPGFYVVGGTFHGPGDDTVDYVSGFTGELTVDPRVFTSPSDIHTIEPFFAVGGGFRPPDQGALLYGAEFGPTLFVEPVPEAPPSTFIALGLCSWLALRAGRRRFARARPRSSPGRGPSARTARCGACGVTAADLSGLPDF